MSCSILSVLGIALAEGYPEKHMTTEMKDKNFLFKFLVPAEKLKTCIENLKAYTPIPFLNFSFKNYFQKIYQFINLKKMTIELLVKRTDLKSTTSDITCIVCRSDIL